LSKAIFNWRNIPWRSL